MRTIDADSNSIRKLSEEFKDYSDEYNKTINNLFDLILKMPTDTKEWVNMDAERFAEYVRQEKDSYVIFGDKLLQYSTFLNTISDELNSNLIKIGEEIE